MVIYWVVNEYIGEPILRIPGGAAMGSLKRNLLALYNNDFIAGWNDTKAKFRNVEVVPHKPSHYTYSASNKLYHKNDHIYAVKTDQGDRIVVYQEETDQMKFYLLQVFRSNAHAAYEMYLQNLEARFVLVDQTANQAYTYIMTAAPVVLTPL